MVWLYSHDQSIQVFCAFFLFWLFLFRQVSCHFLLCLVQLLQRHSMRVLKKISLKDHLIRHLKVLHLYRKLAKKVLLKVVSFHFSLLSEQDWRGRSLLWKMLCFENKNKIEETIRENVWPRTGGEIFFEENRPFKIFWKSLIANLSWSFHFLIIIFLWFWRQYNCYSLRTD